MVNMRLFLLAKARQAGRQGQSAAAEARQSAGPLPICFAACSSALGSMPAAISSGLGPPLPNMPFIACFNIPPLPILPIFFIMSPIWRCIFRSLLSSETSSPAPLAIRFLRLACRICGLARSSFVIDWMSAICCFRILSSKPASLHLFRHLAHAGHHAHHAFHAAHLDHLLKLHLHVVHVETALLEPFHHLLGLFGLDGFLRLLDQARRYRPCPGCGPQRGSGSKVSMRVHLLAQTDKADGLAGDRAHGKRRTTAPVAVHPGQNYAGNADLVVELGRPR